MKRKEGGREEGRIRERGKESRGGRKGGSVKKEGGGEDKECVK